MKYSPLLIICSLLLLLPQSGYTAQDSYIGDTAIYGGSTVTLKPNVLIIFDTSGSMGNTIPVETCQTDTDGDGVADETDNCPNIANSEQLINPCDPASDFDGDGVPDATDNCVATPNPGQEDNDGNDDGDGIGDACEVVGGSYNPAIDYTAMTTAEFCGNGNNSWSAEACQRTRVYECVDNEWDQNGFCTKWDRLRYVDTWDIDTSGQGSCGSSTKSALETTGFTQVNRDMNNHGHCSNSSQSHYYATGNWIDLYGLVSSDNPPTGGATEVCTTENETKNNIAEKVVSDLIQNTDGVNFGLMRFNGSNGGIFMNKTVDGQNYETTIKDMDAIHHDTTTNRTALINIVSDMPHSGYTPLGETLYESMRYFAGATKDFGGSGTYTSPIEASCQPNYIIVITDGMATRDSGVPTLPGCNGDDCDSDNNSGDGVDDSLDDVAYYLYHTDLSDAYTGTQNAKTYTIGFGDVGGDADAVQLLQDTADNGQGASPGTGKSYLADSYQELSAAFSAIIGEVQNVSSAFVAPVVPTSPENKVYSGQRIYLGFFKPKTNGNWLGNLKKFGLDDDGTVLDANGHDATDANGAFLPESVSYWGTSTDAGNVEEGGIGDILSARDASTRNIYTYTGASLNLNDSTNVFSKTNVAITATSLGVATDTIKDGVIDYVYGYDTYDEDIDGDVTEQRDWIMGDILHSKPAIQSYKSFALTDETDTTENQTVIFVGSNDGQLHAFRDADGVELWSFIPPSVLPNLQNLGHNDIHEYVMDGSPILYVVDQDNDGNIGPGPETDDTDPTGVTDNGTNDKVILLVGMRRGGGIDKLDPTLSRGFYYALDVTIPTSPKFLWQLDSSTAGFGELGEAWSDPVIGKIRLGGTDRIVAFISAGYDNNEDLRFGDNQLFPDTTTATTSTILATADSGDISSVGSSSQVNPKGRGIYILELASINSTTGVTTAHTSPQKLWEYVYIDPNDTAAHPVGHNPTYSFVSSIAPLDYDFDGYIDRLYAGDTGGNMWRFDIAAKDNMSTWSGTKIFSANPSNVAISDENPETNGRKIFYRPSIVQEPGYVGVYFGTGDRAHPLNQANIDRMYAVYDRGITTTKTEANLVNTTEDNLQAGNPTADPADLSTCTLTNTSVGCTLQNLYNTDYYGWFIKLDQDAGEKALANPLVYNKVAYFTTFTPNVVTDDPCLSGNLGVGKLYAVNYKTAEAVFNFDTTNDVADNNSYADNENERAKGSGSGEILRRSDRSKTMGSGIPSGAVIVVRGDGTSSALVGCGGGLCGGETKDGGAIIPMYWIME